MKCAEPMTVSELSSLISVGSWTTAALQLILDGATDFLFSLLGHSFGRAIRIYHDESEDATAATVTVSPTEITLTITGGANAGTTSYLFVTYENVSEIVDAIEQADIGFVVTLVEGMRHNEKTANLHTVAATSCLGLSNRQVLCIQYSTETFDGLGEPMIFTSLPLKSVISVIQDGTAVTDYWSKSQGYLIYKYAVGAKYSPYTVDTFSVLQPCNVIVKYIPLWLRIPGVMKLVLRAMVQNTIVDGSMSSESIGDYSYSLGDIWASIAPFWTMLSGYSVNFMP